jgi:hypothetical protein
MPRNALIQLRRDTAANWTSTNPTLAAGEQGFETDTVKFKIGTGSTAWNSLLYATDALNAFKTTADINGSAAYYRPSTIGNTTTSTQTMLFSAAGSAYSVPFTFDTPVTISEIGHKSGSLSGSGTVKYVIYSCDNNNGVPVTKVYESSNVSVSAMNTPYSLTGLSVTLPAGMYWIFVYLTAGSMSLIMTIAQTTPGLITPAPFSTMALALTGVTGNGVWFLNTGTATPPSTIAVTTTANVNSLVPYIAIRRSA